MANYWGVGRLGTPQKVSYTGTAAAIANAIGAGVQKVRVYCTTDAYIAIGKDPTATTSHTPLAAKTAEYFTVAEGEKVSAIQDAANGVLHVTEIV